MNNSGVEIREAALPADLADIQRLWLTYLVWGNDQMHARYGVQPHHPQETVARDIQRIHQFLPPNGCLLLAFAGGEGCGTGALQRLNADTGEIKRMYVDPAFRQLGAGRALLQALLRAAKEAGYAKVRLDSPKFMTAAHSLYRSVGFEAIGPYPEMEVPPAFADYLLFMELDLARLAVHHPRQL